jgi:LacI family transcriptional regulator
LSIIKSCAHTIQFYTKIIDIIENKRKIRIKDIAEKAGVSIGTVDRVIHNRGEVSEKTRQKIMNIVQELNYEPDILASRLASKSEYNFVMLFPDGEGDSTFWQSPLKGVEKALEEIAHYNVNVDFILYDQSDKDSFVKACDKVLQKQPSGVIIAPFFDDPVIKLAAKLRNEDVPYVFINSNIDEMGQLAFIGQDSLQSGYVAAKLMCTGLADNAEILIVNISQAIRSHRHIQKRDMGFEIYLSEREFEDERLLKLNIDNTSQENVNKVLSETIESNPDIKGIFVSNSRVFRVANYLSKTKNNSIRLIGYDLIENNIRMMSEGYIHYLISQKPIEQGYNATMALFNHIVLKKDIQAERLLPIDIIIKENLKYYLNQ